MLKTFQVYLYSFVYVYCMNRPTITFTGYISSLLDLLLYFICMYDHGKQNCSLIFSMTCFILIFQILQCKRIYLRYTFHCFSLQLQETKTLMFFERSFVFIGQFLYGNCFCFLEQI